MKLALQAINELEREGLIRAHAIGGAMALLFHDEPVATYDLDIFCILPPTGLLVSLEPIYTALLARGFHTEAEAVVIGGVPVQFIPAYNPLVTEALEQAVSLTFEGVPVRVLALEHLMAIMVQTTLIRLLDKIGGHSEAASGGSKNPVASQIRDSSTALHSAQNDPERTDGTSPAPLSCKLTSNRISMVQTNRPKDRQRLALLAGNPAIDDSRLRAILTRHELLTAWKLLNPTA